MDPSAISVIQKRYANNGHFYYPEMDKMLSDLIKNPEAPIDIPDNFISKTLDNTNILFKIIRRVKIIFWKIINNTKYYLFPSYRANYKIAVVKIETAYRQKTDEISRLTGKLKFCRDSVDAAQKDVTTLEGKVAVLKEVKESLQEKIAAKTLSKNFFEQLFSKNDVDEVAELFKQEVAAKQKEIDGEQYQLDVNNGILTNALKGLSETITEIQNAHLENFFTNKDLSVPVITLENLTPKEITVKQIKDDIEKLCSEDLSDLFTIFLKTFPDQDAITAWDCNSDGEFTLTLKKPYYVAVPGNDPPGGAVFMFGHKTEGVIKGKLEENHLSFDGSLQTYVNEAGGIITNLNKIEYQSRTDIFFHGSYGIFSGSKSKTYMAVKNDWSQGKMKEYDEAEFKKQVSS